ncbi:ATP-binding protein [uncultured Arcticibacterium sp.]|uniref:ATP-binding protein n=1 Tax=uncultured Arcticibacterium sp. TaxID=2173042 RepID=UPI0030FD1B55
MEPKSIIYRDLVNLENCESEPIHVPGSIQPHGYLLVVNDQHIIKYCSENWSKLKVLPPLLLESSLSSFLSKEDYSKFEELVFKEGYTQNGMIPLNVLDSPMDLLVHRSGDFYILEFEPNEGHSKDIPFLNSTSFEFAELASQAKDLKELAQRSSELIKKITGYDRVMIYKFDEEYNGEVFAEAKEERLESFLGLHYPHTDIPPQARQLYMKNLVRMIADIGYSPVPLLTLNAEASHEQVDLSMSVLRSVSPIHIKYLQNMGVGATLTISLIKDGRLWGLIACHHYSPKNLSFYVRVSALLQGQFLTSRIGVQEIAMNYEKKMSLEVYLKLFQEKLNITESDSLDTPWDNLKLITQADGFFCNSTIFPIKHGEVLEEKELNRLMEYFNLDGSDYQVSNNLVKDYDSPEGGKIAGLLAFSLDVNTYAIWFRKEVKKEIKWAGNPDKAIEKDKDGLSPRKSFASWQEVVSNMSRPWDEVEIDIAKQTIFSLQRHLTYLRSKHVQKRQEGLLQKLKEANEELENINWISTHDLKEPLRKIRIFTSILMDDNKFELPESSQKMIDKINNSASRMQNLIDDLLTLNKTKYLQSDYDEVDLNSLIEEAFLEFEESNLTYSIAPNIPAIKGYAVLLRQLFSNLISNSIKFAAPIRSPHIDIDFEKVMNDNNPYLRINVRDNGLGFENKYAGNIFQVFQRIHSNSNIAGSGVGLAICKKVVDVHSGIISAFGEADKGATFTIDFKLV